MPENRATGARPPLVRTDHASGRGISGRQLRKYHRVVKGVRVPPRTPLDLRTRCHAVAMALPEAVFSHYTAAHLHNLPVPDEALVHVTVLRDVEPRIDGLVAHRLNTVGPFEFIDGLRVESPARTFVDLASRLDLLAMVALGDQVWQRLGSSETLETEVRAGAGRRGIRLARQAMALLHPRAESAMESKLRTLLILGGLPWPEVQFEIFDAFGNVTARIDLAYPELGIAIEYEGSQHLTSRDQWNRDIARYEMLAGRRWIVIRVTAEDLYRRPDEVVERVRTAMARADA